MTIATQDRLFTHPLAGIRFGVVGRVGSGRTTLSVLLARELAEKGYGVCFVDADARPADSWRAFGLEAPPDSLMEFLADRGEGSEARKIPYVDEELVAPIPVLLDELPETTVGRTPDGIVFLSLEKAGPRDDPGGPGPEWAPQDIRLEGDRTLPVTIFKLEATRDAPPPELLASLDWLLVVVDPTFSSVELVADMGERVVQLQKKAPAGTLAPEPIPGGDPQGSSFGTGHHMGLMAVLNHIPDPETEQFFVTAISRQAQVHPIGAIREDWEIREAGLSGQAVPEHKAETRVKTIVDRIEESERQAQLAGMS
jgi:CO dehydrogenase nickel-insertion accessory protein CooC1